MRGGFQLSLVLFALASTAAPAAANSAKSERYTIGRSVELTLNGHISESCEVTGGRSIDLGSDLQGGITVPGSFGLVCNTPFDLTVSSSRGGLAHLTMPDGQGPYAGTLAYDIDMIVPVMNSANLSGVLRAEFNSGELFGRRTISSGDAIAAGGGEFVLRTQEPRGAGLLAGEYSDSLSITVAARL
ncbi:hypothetical protein MTsN3n11_07190 [Qipengyuania sp. MTN3-11]